MDWGLRVTAVTALAGFFYIAVVFAFRRNDSSHPHFLPLLLLLTLTLTVLLLTLHRLTVCSFCCICSLTARLTHSVLPLTRTPNGLPFHSFRRHQRPLPLPAAYLLCPHSISDLHLHLSSRVTCGSSVRHIWPNSARRAPPPSRNRLRTNISYRNFLR